MLFIAINMLIKTRDMRTIQITVDEELLHNVDRAIKKIHTTRSAFIRKSLTISLKNLETFQLEAKSGNLAPAKTHTATPTGITTGT